MHRLALILASLLPAIADEVTLSDDSRLSGTVTALADTGQVSLASPLSLEPFQLRAEKIRLVEFSQSKKSADEHDSMLQLINGDEFPCDLRGIDEDSVQVDTSFAGPIDIPRASVKTAQLGVRPRKVIYKGPDNETGWTVKNGWRFDSRRFVSDGSGTLGRKFDIPGSFALKFHVTWRNTPNIQVYFADDTLETTGKADRYYVTFNGSGLELKRQQSNDGRPYLAMAAIPREPSDFPDSSLEVELLVDRQLAQVQIVLNGEKGDIYRDPLGTAPTGQGIMFRSNIGGDDSQSIDGIEVREWDPSADRHRSETRGDETQDVVITRSSDRGTGKIIGMKPGNDGGVVVYKGPHHPEPVELPASDVSTLFFAHPAETDPVKRPPLVLGLRGRGSLGVTGCTFEGDFIAAEHPLLGKLSIRREAVARLERAVGKKTEKKEDQE